MHRREAAGPRGGRYLLLAMSMLLVGVGTLEANELRLQRPDKSPSDPDRRVATDAVPRESRSADATVSDFSPREAPCVLIDTGTRKPEHKRLAPGATPTEPRAFYDPSSGVPPNALSRERNEQLKRLLTAPSVDALQSELVAASNRFAGAPPDTQRVLVLRVEFENDTPGALTTGDGRFDLRDLRDTTAVQFDPPPHDRRYFERHMEALKRYYDSQLQGRLVLEFDIFPAGDEEAYRLPDTYPYGPWIFSNSNPDVLQHAIDLVGDTLAEVDESDPTVDFSRYDHHMIFHAGSDFQGDVNRDTPWDIPSFNLFVTDPFVVQDSVSVNLVLVVPETVSQDDFAGALNGVLAHEFGHQLAFWDLYDVRVGAPVVGAFSLMDSGDNLFALIEDPPGSGINRAIRGTLPASIDPFHKLFWFSDAVDLKNFAADISGEVERREYELETVQLGNDIAMVPLNASEFLLFENRFLDLNGDGTVIVRQDPETGVIMGPGIDPADSSSVSDSLETLAKLEYDWLIPGEGVIGWHIDWLSVFTGFSQPGGGANIFFSRPGVGVIEADGIRDIGTASNEYLGGPYDPFFKGGYDLLDPTTVPSSNTNDGTDSGVTVAVLDSIGPNMRIGVKSTRFPGGWPIPVYSAFGTDEQCVVFDATGPRQPTYIFPARDPFDYSYVLLQCGPFGETANIFTFLPDSLDEGTGLAARTGFIGRDGAISTVGFVSEGRLRLVDGVGFDMVEWPEGIIGDVKVTTTPVLTDSLAWIGCSDGKIRAIAARGDLVRATIDTGGTSPVRVLGVGAPASGIGETGFWATDDGHVGAFSATSLGGLWTTLGNPTATPASILAVPDENDALDYIVAWNDGSVDRLDPAGARRSGWPYHLGSAPVPDIAVTDLQADGELETIVVGKDGSIHAIGGNGVALVGWPRSVWSRDESPYLDQTSGPRVLDLSADGSFGGPLELLLLRGDGLLFAWDGDGNVVDGYPVSFGGQAFHGPHLIPGVRTPTSTPRFVVGAYDLFRSDSLTVEAVGAVRSGVVYDDAVGVFPMTGVDTSRSRVYPTAWLPAGVEAEADLSDLRLYPNPVRGQDLTVRFVVDAPTELDLEAFDLDGRSVARTTLHGEPGAAGNQIRWDLSALASGLYHVRVRAPELGFERFERIAIVR
ncbi:MAG: hypothetical protein R3E97_10845 [Candidatus Eisenbacteria bacterium]